MSTEMEEQEMASRCVAPDGTTEDQLARLCSRQTKAIEGLHGDIARLTLALQWIYTNMNGAAEMRDIARKALEGGPR